MTMCIFWSIDIFTSRRFKFEGWDYIYAEYDGNTAIIIAIMLLSFGIYNGYVYFSPIKNELFWLIKKRKWINIAYPIWFLFILFPVYEFRGMLSRLILIFLFCLNLIICLKFTSSIRKQINNEGP